jgi:hypothetical protein
MDPNNEISLVVYVSKKVDLQEGDATSSIVQRTQLVYISETYLIYEANYKRSRITNGCK